MKNKYGLDRNIPAQIKREIRQRDGFGCIICGLGIIEYEHVNPEFNEAKIHDPACMTILCPGCHHKVTTGMWSKDKVIEGMKSPKCLAEGYSKEIFDIGVGYPTIKIGSNEFKRVNVPLLIKATPLLIIDEPQNPGEPFKITASFFDSNGINTLNIIENEWQASSDNWDVEVVGNSIVIKEKQGKIHLKLDSEPPEAINISHLDMSLNGSNIKVTGGKLFVVDQKSGGSIELSGSSFVNCRFGIYG